MLRYAGTVWIVTTPVRLPGQQLLLGRGELLVAEYAGGVQLRQLLQLGC